MHAIIYNHALSNIFALINIFLISILQIIAFCHRKEFENINASFLIEILLCEVTWRFIRNEFKSGKIC